MPKVMFQQLSQGAFLPTYGSPDAIGVDLYAALSMGEHTLWPGERILIKIGIAVAIPEGFYGRIAPRSGSAFKAGIDVLAGVIDPDYRDEIGVLLINHGKECYAVRPGDRIAQMIFERADRLTPEWVGTVGLPSTVRGKGGFGSTGV